MTSGTAASLRLQSRQSGFTILELMFTVVIAAILGSLAAPSFREFIATQRIRNASFDLVTALNQVRSEAITRSALVYLCRPSSNWANGWKVTTDATCPASGSAILLDQSAFAGLTITDSAGLSAITYAKDGRITTGSSTKFTINSATTLSGVKARCVSIGLSGVPSSSVGACT